MAEKDESTVWTGRDLYDADGDKIGTVEDIRYAEITLEPKWLVVKTGLLGTKHALVPAIEVRHEGDRLVVSYDKDFVKHAPEAAHDEYVLEEEERKACTYYGLDYVWSVADGEEGCKEGDEEAAAAEDAPATDPAG